MHVASLVKVKGENENNGFDLSRLTVANSNVKSEKNFNYLTHKIEQLTNFLFSFKRIEIGVKN